MIDAPAHDAAARAPSSGESSWLDLGRTLLGDLAGVLRERLHLAALEGQQFVHAAGRLLAFGMVAAVLVLTTWFVVVGALVALLVHVGLPLAVALVVGAGLNLAGAAFAWVAMRRQLSLMGFPATLRALQAASPAVGPAPVSPAEAAAVQADSTAALREMRAQGDGSGDRFLRATAP